MIVPMKSVYPSEAVFFKFSFAPNFIVTSKLKIIFFYTAIQMVQLVNEASLLDRLSLISCICQSVEK